MNPPSTTPEAPRPRTSGAARILLLAIGTFVVGVARYGSEIDAPFDDSLASINGTNYTAAIERSFRLCGYEKLRGVPYLYTAPTPDPAAFGVPYLNHPTPFRGFVHAATNLFGFTETGLRLPPILCSAAAAALLAILCARRFGVGPAAGGAAFFLACPMSWHYGWMANYEAPLLLCAVALTAWHVAFRERSIVFYLPAYLIFFAATQIDWAGYFLAPALWLYEAARPSDERRKGRVAVYGALGLAGFACSVGHMAYGLDVGFGRALETVYATAIAAAGVDGLTAPAWTAGDWFARQAHNWRFLFTEGGCFVAAFGLVEFLRRRFTSRDDTAALAFALLAPAILNVALFRRAAYVHDYWWYAALPFATFSAAAIFALLRRVPLIAPILAAALAVYGAYQTVEIRRPQRARAFAGPRAVAADINRFVGPNDALMTQADLGQVGFYVDAWVTRPLEPPFSPEVVVPGAAELMKAGMLSVERLVVFIPTTITFAGDASPKAQSATVDALRSVGTTTLLTNGELAKTAPTLARFVNGADLAIIVVEKP